MSKKPVEKRFDDRLGFQLLVSYTGSNAEEENNFSYNLSSGGMFIETRLPYALNSFLNIHFEFPADGSDFKIKGQVAWIRKNATQNEPAGMGIKFIEVNNEKKDWLIKAVAVIEESLSA